MKAAKPSQFPLKLHKHKLYAEMASSVNLLFTNEDNKIEILLKYTLLLFLTQPKFIPVWEYTKSSITHVPCVQSITGQKRIPADRFLLLQHPYIHLAHVAQSEIRCKMTLNVIPATYLKTTFNNLQNLIRVVLRTSLNTKTKKGFLLRQTPLTARNEEQLCENLPEIWR